MTAGNGNVRKQRLELTWIGKENRPRLEPRILRPMKEQSYGKPGDGGIDDNILIQGDNLLALKSLEQQFADKVKCVYIDPPYNTGSAFEQYDDGLEHSLWLSLMRDRLELLRRLLSLDGSIWVSIDDTEMPYLRAVMDEVFGRRNFVASVIWRRNYAPKSSAQFFSDDHDYILVYAREVASLSLNFLQRTDAQNAIYKNVDNDPRGLWRPDNLSARNPYSLGTYPIETPRGRKISGPPAGRYWAISKSKLEELDADGRAPTGTTFPHLSGSCLK